MKTDFILVSSSGIVVITSSFVTHINNKLDIYYIQIVWDTGHTFRLFLDPLVG